MSYEIFHYPTDYSTENLTPGWYWQKCIWLSLGTVSIPDGDPHGPFGSKKAAESDAKQELQ